MQKSDFKTAAAFCREYEPVSYAVEPFVRSSSVYTLTAKTGVGKTALLISTALAKAAGRGDLLKRETKQRRVAYLTAENPDDLRMRMIATADHFEIDLAAIANDFLVLDRRVEPEELVSVLRVAAIDAPFSLITVDTLAAFFDGKNINDPVEGGDFIRRLRPLTQIAGRPPVIVAAHPKKDAGNDNLVPYGAGAILNEVDGNLTLCKVQGGLIRLHWQGKLRGVEFEPVNFRVELVTSPNVKDVKGCEVQLPILKPVTIDDARQTIDDDRQHEESALDKDVATLQAISANPAGSLETWSTAAGIHKSSIRRNLERLARPSQGKLVRKTLGKWSLTAAGHKAIEDVA
jgi:hypothetical protein